MARSRIKVVLLFLAYAVALTLLEFTYHYLDVVTRNKYIPWGVPFLEQMTGVFGAVALIRNMLTQRALLARAAADVLSTDEQELLLRPRAQADAWSVHDLPLLDDAEASTS